jgi:hypothetical protein
VRGAGLPDEEPGEQRRARHEWHGHGRIAPAAQGLLDQPERDPGEAKRAQKGADHVHARVGVALPARGHGAHDQDQRGKHNRQVDGEDPAPRRGVHELATD